MSKATATWCEVLASETGFIEGGRRGFGNSGGIKVVVENVVKSGCVAKEEAFVDMVLNFVRAITKSPDNNFAAKNSEVCNVWADSCDCFIWCSFQLAVGSYIP